ncbi:hypothetical protein [Ilyobacter polytropus]|uniref:Uncharacterized protein n=1 Tax=Ilyobacter polytropus (strain ATCC 51220 / DSM 2926 / LMG 16218 / CuHBu1) TaxID=572544 RepID=E3H7E8_ILYPC|nr:hypothetical protein [Ilyobacter polytropus]ADO82844.1 hypothetical protein Ilyop_1063 [Ilyobacter polytropus DSM 2926]
MKKYYLPNGKIQVTLNIFNKIHTFEAFNEQEITTKLIAIENGRAS